MTTIARLFAARLAKARGDHAVLLEPIHAALDHVASPTGDTDFG